MKTGHRPTARGALFAAAVVAAQAVIAGSSAPLAIAQDAPASRGSVQCKGDNGGLSLSPRFCASVFADNLGHVRHLAVAADGTVYANTWSGRYYPGAPPPPGGFLIALKDTGAKGYADMVERFGATPADGGAGGTGIALYRDGLYAEEHDRIVRYELTPGAMAPKGPPTVIVSGLPLTGDHPMHPFVIDRKGALFIDMGSATNACQEKNRIPLSPGIEACKEKETRAGTWRYDANKTGQVFSPAERYASGIRNGEGFAFDTAGRLFVTQHGRDVLFGNWPKLYTADQSAELPAEELLLLSPGADYGWPECYYDQFQQKLVLAPEYGGDGGKTTGLCAQRQAPIAAFPGHWAPNDLAIYHGRQFPSGYRGGAFIAFHGSWNRAPLPQGGYNVVFQPLAGGRASGPYVIFADGFAGPSKGPGRAQFRPTGLAEGPDGSLYIADDVHGRIWRITYNGDGSDKVSPAPTPVVATNAPPRSDAGASKSALPTPPGATAELVALGDRIFHGQASNGTCSGCHGSDAGGTPVGPPLNRRQWLWGDGGLAALTTTIEQGVPNPKQYRAAMPPLGGAPLSKQDLAAVAAYVWAIGHAGTN